MQTMKMVGGSDVRHGVRMKWPLVKKMAWFAIYWCVNHHATAHQNMVTGISRE